MNFIAKKYTILMNNEPIDIWIKNNEIKKSQFMDKKIKLDLNEATIKQIQSFPTKVVNGANFENNLNFTQGMSKMMSQQLELAISKNDKKTLSRFARSDLIPENIKNNFMEAVNRQNGLRGMLIKAVNKTNSIFQNLAKKIDNYFDKVNDKVANQKVDKYLEEYQLKQFNKAPPIKDLDLTKNVDGKLMDMAQDFYENKDFLEKNINEKVVVNEFMEKAAKHGYSVTDSQLAYYKAEQISTLVATEKVLLNITEQNKNRVDELESKLSVFEKKEASPNETLEHFKTLTQNMNPIDKIDVLITNKEYLILSDSKKLEFENKNIFTQEPALERAAEAKEVSKIIEQKPQYKTAYKRDATINFSSQETKTELNQTWSKLQKINNQEQAQNRDFMNVSAVKFGGVSKEKLESWQNFAIKNGANKEVTQKYVDASLRNAVELEKAGILTQSNKKEGEFKFKDQFAKQTLFQNLDKPVNELANLNKGEQVTIEAHPIKELSERISDISSEKSFESLKNENGQIEADKLLDYAQKLEKLAISLKETANNKAVTQEDLKTAERGTNQSQSKDNGRERA